MDLLNEQHLLHLARRIKPVVRNQNKLFFIHPKDVIVDVYFRDCTFHSPATRLRPLMEIETTHKATISSLFRPSIAEVLCQIPADAIAQVCAFETQTDITALKYNENTHTHHTKTILYGGILPEAIKNQEVILRGHRHTYPLLNTSLVRE